MRMGKQETARYFSRTVENYWSIRNSLGTKILQTLLNENFEYFEPREILEVGCGPGIFTETLCKKARTVATDFSYEMLYSVKHRDLEAELVLADMDHLPFRAKSFDMIVAYRVVDYSKNDRELLKRFSQLAPVILLTLPRYDSINGLARFLLDWIGILLKRNVRHKYYSLVSKDGLRLAKAAGLTVLKLTPYNKGLAIHMTLSTT